MPATIRDGEPVSAPSIDVAQLQEIDRLLSVSAELPLEFVISGGDVIAMPEALARIVRSAARHLAQGEAVAVVPIQQELTTQQAADYMNVSRPYLIELLDRGDIPYHRVGTHRRIRFDDLMAYKCVRDGERREGLRQLTQMSQRLGLYETPEQGALEESPLAP